MTRKSRFPRLFDTALLAFALLALASVARASDSDPREFLLSPEFASDFYGTDAVDLLTFDASNCSLQLPFRSDPRAQRASLDQKLSINGTQYDAFEIVYDIDDPSAIGYSTLYFHSPGGWYGNSGGAKRVLPDGKVVVVYTPGGFSPEDKPEGFDKIDAVRISYWRGADVDAKLTVRSFRASRAPFAIVDVDDGGIENARIANDFAKMLERAGLKAERVDADKATAESLKRYSCVYLPIAGKIKPAAVDALCDYVDQGGFLFAFYNVPDKLLAKLGVKLAGFVNCRQAGIELSGMAIDPEARAIAKERGFDPPEKIGQNSWNYYKVALNERFETTRRSALFGDSKARVIGKWALADGSETSDPALVASPNGLYCSHIFTDEDQTAKKALLEALVVSADPGTTRRLARAEWLEYFRVGLDPEADPVAESAKALDALEAALKDRGWSLADAARLMRADAGEDPDRSEAIKFARDLAEIKTERVAEYVASLPSRENEGRLWWEHSGCGIYPGDWDRTMKELSEAGFNAVVPNMLWGGDAYYKSDVLPVDPKVERYGDQIEQAVKAGKKYGVEVHAWMVCFNASNSPKSFLDEMRAQGRLQKTLSGEEKPWLCPSCPENRALQLAALEEVATKYDVDGVHFDYIRFPDGNTCYCDGCKERFSKAYREKTGKELGEFPKDVLEKGTAREEFLQWRRDQITALVRDVHKSLKAKRPDIKLSAAVFPGYPGVRDSIAQDWGLWVEEGLLDFVCPMDYSSDPNAFLGYVKRQLPYVEGKIPIYPGIGMTATGISMQADEVALQAEIARRLGANGFTIFNLTKSTADKILPTFKEGLTAKPTKAPHSR